MFHLSYLGRSPALEEAACSFTVRSAAAKTEKARVLSLDVRSSRERERERARTREEGGYRQGGCSGDEGQRGGEGVAQSGKGMELNRRTAVPDERPNLQDTLRGYFHF